MDHDVIPVSAKSFCFRNEEEFSSTKKQTNRFEVGKAMEPSRRQNRKVER